MYILCCGNYILVYNSLGIPHNPVTMYLSLPHDDVTSHTSSSTYSTESTDMSLVVKCLLCMSVNLFVFSPWLVL